MRDARRRDLAELGANLDRHLGLHQLTRDQRDSVPHEITVLTSHHMRNDISSHPSPFGHRGAPSHRLLVEPTSLDATMIGTPAPIRDAPYTTTADETLISVADATDVSPLTRH
jgi:hypothetical protein